MNLTGLEESQHLGLERGIHFTDLVEKQRPTIRLQRGAQSVGGRPRKRSLHMTKQLTFQQVSRDRRTIDGNERLVLPL